MTPWSIPYRISTGAEIHSTTSITTMTPANRSGRRNGRNTLAMVRSRVGAIAWASSTSGSSRSGGSASTAASSLGETLASPASVEVSALTPPGPPDPEAARVAASLV